MRVLLVDDEAAFTDPLAERLALRGVEAAVARDAEEALSLSAAGSFDVAFLDVGLPGMDGVDLARLLRERHPDLALVMLSGAADMGRAVAAMRRGALNWLSKPVALEALLAECRRAGTLARARRQAERLADTARMRALGRVAQGVAHEVNNPLNTMMHAAGLIEDALEDPAAAASRPLASERELEQICLHIVENALDAMPAGGALRLSGRVPDGAASGAYELAFADTGPGLSAEAAPRIFEPFFSTKESRAGRHAGLGLAVAWSLAQARGGALTAENRPEGGALFRLLLPLPPPEPELPG